jgi:hypothetical protein
MEGRDVLIDKDGAAMPIPSLSFEPGKESF